MKKNGNKQIAEAKFWQYVVATLKDELDEVPDESTLGRVKRGRKLQHEVAKCIYNALKDETVANMLSTNFVQKHIGVDFD